MSGDQTAEHPDVPGAAPSLTDRWPQSGSVPD